MNKKCIEHWVTVAVTALPPGWRNVYRGDDGALCIWPCPAVLLQESRYTETFEDVPAVGDHLIRQHRRDDNDSPYETQVVFADHGPDGWLEPAYDTGGYVGTVAPDEDPNIFGNTTPPSDKGANQQ